MGFSEFLERREKRLADEQLENVQKRRKYEVYNDIAVILWYTLLYDDMLKHKQSEMDTQQTPFRIYDWGTKFMRFGPVVALTSAEDIERFQKRAHSVLKDKGYGSFKVRVYPDCILVSV